MKKRNITLFSIGFVFKRIPVYSCLKIVSKIVELVDFFWLANLNKDIMNSLASSIEKHAFNTEILIFMGFLAGSRIVKYLFNQISSHFETLSLMKHNDKFAFEIHAILSKYPVEVFDDPSKLSYVDQAITDSGAILNYFHTSLNLIFALFSSISIVYLSFHIDPFIALLTILISIPSFFVNKKIKNRNYEMEKSLNTSMRGTNYYMRIFHAQLNNMEIKFYHLDEFLQRKYDILKKEINKQKISFMVKSGIIYFCTTSANTICSSIVKLLIVYRIVIKNLTFGDYSLFSTYIDKLQSSFSSILVSVNDLIIDQQKIKNFVSYFYPNNDHLMDTASLSRSKVYKIRFDDVSFVYPGTQTYVLKNLNFSFSSNESVAFAGLNGAGKSTLIKLILRYYTPTTGKIYINDIDINSINEADYYNLFSVLFQDLTYYQISLKENIALSDVDNVDESRVDELLDLVDMGSHKQFKDTTLGRELTDDGIILSRGQLQKVNLARALYKKANWYIMDEPSASVDALSEQMIFEQMLKLKSNETGLIVVSHRLSHLTKMTKIFFLDEGNLLEQGSHDELMALNGMYKKLYDIQKSAFE